MESIKEFFKHLNYRLSSPFIFSFILSWLVFNWQVTIALIFYNKELLAIDGYYTYNCLISQTVTWCSGFWLPFLGALFYTFVLNPFGSFVIEILYTWVQKVKDKKNLEILQDGQISMEKYLSLRDDLNKRKKTLEKVIKQESATVVELEKKSNEVLTLSSELNEQKKKVLELGNTVYQIKQDQSPDVLQGIWKNEFVFPDGRSGVEVNEIKGRDIFLVDKGKKTLLANIQYFRYNEEKQQIFFVKRMINRQRKVGDYALTMVVNDSQYNNRDGTISGYEDGDIKIKLTPFEDETRLL